MTTAEHFDAYHIHTTPEGRHFRHGDGIEVDGEGNPIETEVETYTPQDEAAAIQASVNADKQGVACFNCGHHHGFTTDCIIPE